MNVVSEYFFSQDPQTRDFTPNEPEVCLYPGNDFVVGGDFIAPRQDVPVSVKYNRVNTLAFSSGGPIYFKLQAAIVGALLGLAMLFYFYILDQPLMNTAMQKYFGDKFYVMMEVKGIARPWVDELLRRISRDFGWFFIGHAGLTAFTALRCNKWIWFAVRVPLLYALMLAGMRLEIMFMGS